MNRAAQFSPFAALTEYNAAIQETARQTDSFTELEEGRKRQLNEQLWIIRENLEQIQNVKSPIFNRMKKRMEESM